jgi:hypothetical protein
MTKDTPASRTTPPPHSREFRRRMEASACFLWISLLPGLACANSQGSPICEVNTLPLIEMSPTLANPAPQGWTLIAPARFFPGRAVELRLAHPDPQRRARGVLIWAKAGQFEGAGSFALPANGRWAYIPAPALCGTWAISHTDNQPKSLDALVFQWTGSGAQGVILRAFIIEDCSHPAGCRDQQALTPIVFLEAGLFADGFEDASAASTEPKQHR